SESDSLQQANHALLKKLFESYDVNASPFNTKSSNSSATAGRTLNVTLMRARLIGLNERERQFTANIGIVVEYSDPRLSWDPLDFHSIENIYLTEGAIWFPKFFPCDRCRFIGYLAHFNNIEVNYRGEILSTFQFTVTYNCDIRNADFPFDEQLCSLCFSLSGYRQEELDLLGFSPSPPDLYVRFF
ncbi:hypothetical protein PMAYCL1PPCAC_17413, partial [Pristionchus mayeri]